MESTTERKTYALGYWIATHRVELHRVNVVLWLIINIGLWLSVGVRTVSWVSHMPQDVEIINALTAQDVFWNTRVVPKEIAVQKLFAVRYDEKSIDIVAQLYNPNSIWAAETTSYDLIMNGVSLDKGSLSVAPLQQRYVTHVRIPFTGEGLPSLKMNIDTIQWRKMADAATRLPVQSWQFVPTGFREIQGDAAEVFKTELSFSVVNESIFGFRQARAVLVMTDADGTPQAVSTVVIDKILTKESRPVILRWPKALSRSLKPQLYIDVDVLDSDLVIRTLE